MKKLIILIALVGAFGAFSAKACDSDPTAFNYNPLVPDSVTACVPKIYGCMNRRGINFNSLANTPSQCNIPGGTDPLRVSQPLWGGLNGYDVEKNFITLALGEKITYKLPVYWGTEFKGNVGASFTETCPTWFPSPVMGKSACWTTIRR